MAATALETVRDYTGHEYKYGFVTDIEVELAPKGLSEDIVRLISAKKDEPAWMLEWRLKALAHWRTMTEPDWAKVSYPPIDYQAISYYAAPKSKDARPKSLDEVDPELLRTYEKLGIPLAEQEVLAGVAVRRGVRQRLGRDHVQGEARRARHHLLLVLRGGARSIPSWCASTSARSCPTRDNFFATLNSAVFTDGSFVYVPKGVRCPMELSTYFRINAAETGQFERTLIIAEEGAT